MTLAEITPTIVQIDGGGLIWALGALGGGIGSGIAGAVKIWVSYRTERDTKDRAQKEAHITREEKLADRADARDTMWRTEGNKTIDKLLEIAQASAKLSSTVASELSKVTDSVSRFHGRLDEILKHQQEECGK